MDIKRLTEQIKINCNISDAKFWGYYSICGMLMRLRELYRTEHSLMPWEAIPKEDITEWIDSRETLWESLEKENLRPLGIEERFYDPFEADELNTLLNGYGLVYGGGYGRFNKPTFFLARLNTKRELHDHRVYYAGRELCRDLSASVAMLQGRCIFIRIEPLKALLWEKLQELRGRKFSGALKEAFSVYGIDGTEAPAEGLYRKIEALTSEVSELLVMHELGEAFEEERSGEWLGILQHNRDRLTEFYLRGIKDLLADTSGMGPLKSIVEKRNRGLLGFYIVLMDGIRKELFPEIMNALQCFVESNDWSVIEEARGAGYKRAHGLMSDILRMWNKEGRIEDIGALVRKSLD